MEDNKPFPYYPPIPTKEALIRSELSRDLEKWENNNPAIAKDIAASLVKVIQEQFGLNVNPVQ
jgi:hypothetical protein